MPFIISHPQHAMSPKAFAQLGADAVAYVRAVRSEEVGFLHAEAPLLTPGHLVFVLHAADGTPLTIAECREMAVVAAEEQQLDTVSIH
jgi:hypothetical protein